jgi:hypothetical protein
MKTLKYAYRCVPAEDDHNQSSTAYPAAQWLTGSVATRPWIICVLRHLAGPLRVVVAFETPRRVETLH